MSELVVFSHLRWTFVWQRPQHLISRLARGRQTWFVEEPLPSTVREPILRSEQHGAVTRVWLEVPSTEEHLGFGAAEAAAYKEALRALLGDSEDRIAWLYTPMAFDLAQAVGHDLLVLDVMDDLASFKYADAGVRFAQRQSLQLADVVFTGGRSLQRSVADVRPDAHLFASGVEPEHYAVERPPRLRGAPPVAGYVGVIDERIDLELVGALAAALPGWEIRMVGPVLKIDPDSLPRRDNITYPGAQPYERLPHVLAGFDVALMPFALNESTRSISPTKTLEYLAAGLPVVSTRVPDVVADHESVVALADDAEGFAAACRAASGWDRASHRVRVEALLSLHHWDAIAARMEAILLDAATERGTGEPASSEATPRSGFRA
ncbi:MAG TPA: glycosyltransferase [Gaiellaceae bacterium]|nr:glycosyltransferase [Gaiellaceae bacterium]